MTPRRILVGTVGLLVVFTLLRAGHVFGDLSDAVLVLLSLGVTFAALRLGMTRAQLGLERQAVGSGVRTGLAVFLLVLVVVIIGAIIPATSEFLHDDRVQVGVGGLARELVLSILIGTVIPEELLFRGVILGAGIEQWGRRRGALISAVLFACWHIAPTLAGSGGNLGLADAASTWAGQLALVLGAMVSTFLAGLVFAWLRMRSGSVVAPMIAHLSTNGVAFTVAWVVAR